MDGGATSVRPHRFTVAEYHRMADAGILGEDSHVELIRGQIVDMAPVGAPHLGMVNRLTRLLPPVLAGRASLSVQNPVHLVLDIVALQGAALNAQDVLRRG
jgi:hypothetical protein